MRRSQPPPLLQGSTPILKTGVAVLNIRRFVLKLRPEAVALYLLYNPPKYFRLIDRRPDYRAHS